MIELHAVDVRSTTVLHPLASGGLVVVLLDDVDRAVHALRDDLRGEPEVALLGYRARPDPVGGARRRALAGLGELGVLAGLRVLPVG